MRDYINIGSTPAEESSAQTADPEYYEKAMTECCRFIDLLRRVFGPEPKGAKLNVKGFPSEHGTYFEVVCYYDDDIPESAEYAFRVETESPDRWDDDRQFAEKTTHRHPAKTEN